ncbi:hypothetical protein XENOCAPTIV_017874, partial [Xenoophorus captivus]
QIEGHSRNLTPSKSHSPFPRHHHRQQQHETRSQNNAIPHDQHRPSSRGHGTREQLPQGVRRVTLTQTHPVTGCGFIRMSEFPLLAPRPESGFTDSLQIVGSEGQFGRRRRHGSEETRQQCIENSREHGSDGYDDSRGTLFFSPSLTTFYVFFYYFPTCLRLLLQMVLVELPAW